MANEPMIKFETNGVASRVDYNVPEPVAYDGTNIIELEIDPAMFNPPPVLPYSATELAALTLDAVTAEMRAGFSDVRLFPDLGLPPGSLVWADVVPGPSNALEPYNGCYLTKYGPRESALLWLAPRLRNLAPAEVLRNLRERRNLAILRLSSRIYDYRWLEPASDGARPHQRLAIIEYHRLSSFLGAYGAGRTINTFSLLPGEKAKVTVKTFKRTAETTRQASSILDSLNDSSASDFESTVQDERSDKSTRSQMDSWHVEGELTGQWLGGNVKLEAGAKGSSSASREQFGRRVGSALEKHVASASNKRDIKVEQSTEAASETSEENVTERELRNVNLGHTLNFVFRQMNQEYLTLLHLLDVKIGYTDGLTTKAIPLYALDDFLREVIVTQKDTSGVPLSEDKQFRTKLKQQILDELVLIYDYKGAAHALIEPMERKDASGKSLGTYHRVKRLVTEYEVVGTGTKVMVAGIVLSAMYNVIRTDGIITEALLGRSPGLDTFSQELQEQTVRELKAKNNLLALHVAREQAAQRAVETKRKTTVDLIAKLYPLPPPPTP